ATPDRPLEHPAGARRRQPLRQLPGRLGQPGGQPHAGVADAGRRPLVDHAGPGTGRAACDPARPARGRAGPAPRRPQEEAALSPDIIALGIPVMIGCVIVEFLHDLRQKVRNFRLNATVSNISCGILEQATGFISKGLFIGLYGWLYAHGRLATIADSWWVFLLL